MGMPIHTADLPINACVGLLTGSTTSVLFGSCDVNKAFKNLNLFKLLLLRPGGMWVVGKQVVQQSNQFSSCISENRDALTVKKSKAPTSERISLTSPRVTIRANCVARSPRCRLSWSYITTAVCIQRHSSPKACSQPKNWTELYWPCNKSTQLNNESAVTRVSVTT